MLQYDDIPTRSPDDPDGSKGAKRERIAFMLFSLIVSAVGVIFILLLSWAKSHS